MSSDSGQSRGPMKGPFALLKGFPIGLHGCNCGAEFGRGLSAHNPMSTLRISAIRSQICAGCVDTVGLLQVGKDDVKTEQVRTRMHEGYVLLYLRIRIVEKGKPQMFPSLPPLAAVD